MPASGARCPISTFSAYLATANPSARRHIMQGACLKEIDGRPVTQDNCSRRMDCVGAGASSELRRKADGPRPQETQE
jgi:hypothetical protein